VRQVTAFRSSPPGSSSLRAVPIFEAAARLVTARARKGRFIPSRGCGRIPGARGSGANGRGPAAESTQGGTCEVRAESCSRRRCW
jgi:hypothetical protein